MILIIFLLKEEFFNKKKFFIKENGKKVRFQENYQPKVPSTFMEEKQTGMPLTSYVSEKFLDANKFRSPYDLHWMKVYNSNDIVENFYSGIGKPSNCKCNPSNILYGTSECSNCQNKEDNGTYTVKLNTWTQKSVENYSGPAPPPNCKCNTPLMGIGECSNCQNKKYNGMYMVENNKWTNMG